MSRGPEPLLTSFTALVAGDFDVILLVRAVDDIELPGYLRPSAIMPGVLDMQTFLVFEDLDTR